MYESVHVRDGVYSVLSVLFRGLSWWGPINAVNVTDGLRWLMIGLMVISAGALTVLAYTTGNREFANYLQLFARNPRTAELTIFCGSMTGASLGFSVNAQSGRRFHAAMWKFALTAGRRDGKVAVLIKQETAADVHRGRSS